MANLFNNFIFEPILEILLWIYNNLALGDLGLAIIMLTIFIRIVLFPFFYKSSKDQALIRKLQPKVDEIKKTHKEDKQKQTEELMSLYKEHKLNPFSGFLLLIIQLPIFIGIFKIFKDTEIITQTFTNFTFLGIINLVEVSIPLVVIASILQYIQGKISLNSGKQPQNKKGMAKFGKSMIYFMPFISFIILTQLPSALAVYWITSSIFSTGQSYLVDKKVAKIKFNNKESKVVRQPAKKEIRQLADRPAGGDDKKINN